MDDTLTDLYSQHQSHLHRFSTMAYNNTLKAMSAVERIHGRELYDIIFSLTERDKALLLKGKFTTKRLKNLRITASEFSKGYAESAKNELLISGAAIAAYEIKHTEKMLNAIATVPAPKPTTEAAAVKAAKDLPLLGNSMTKYVDDIAPATFSMLMSEITDGTMATESEVEIARRIKGTAAQKFKDGGIGRIKNKVERTVRTTINHIANSSRDETYRSNGVKKVMWRSTLDGRTSKICASRDGKIYPADSGARPPAHPNCRSVMLPYLGTKPQGLRPYVADKRTVGNIPVDQRSGIVGNVQASTNYEQWFARQSSGFQREWLGRSRYELYKKGNYKISSFVDKRGKQYNLDQLKAKDSATFAELGL